MDVGNLLLGRQAKSGPVGWIDALMVLDHLLGISAIEDEFDNRAILRWSRSRTFRELDESVVNAMGHIASDSGA